MKFLHIADVHLGCTRYHLPESPRDFFDAWSDVLRRYAIGENVDFVLIAGDFFHKQVVPPETMNYAVEGLSMMREAGIPVVAIEGNHDKRSADNEYSWLRSLSRWGFLILLEPETERGRIIYRQWDHELRRGGYLDIGAARIFGSHWYGDSSRMATAMLAEAIRETGREDAFRILMLHTDVEGHQTHPIPALPLDAISRLRSVTDYIALGHTHLHYTIDGWAFNPGSIEITNVSEFHERRGAFVVTFDEQKRITAVHTDDYLSRPFQRLSLNTEAIKTPEEFSERFLQLIREEARAPEPDSPKPIIEVTLRGRLSFPASALRLSELKKSAEEIAAALHVRIKNNTVPIEFAEFELSTDDDRDQIERRVIEGLAGRDRRFERLAGKLPDLVIGVKRLALSDEAPTTIAGFISSIISGNESG
ncbi:MAG: hypothetical protein C4324_03620 [Blastocatellia bacterium]